jgi:hypothetical protein
MEKGTLVFSGVGDEIRHANLRETYLGAAGEGAGAPAVPRPGSPPLNDAARVVPND